jgi:hypothetical protein
MRQGFNAVIEVNTQDYKAYYFNILTHQILGNSTPKQGCIYKLKWFWLLTGYFVSYRA